MPEYPKLRRALNYMVGRCDGARTRDGAGFNRFDSAFGRKLADDPNLTPGQAEAALKLLYKYKETQLEPAGFDWDAIEDEIEQGAEESVRPTGNIITVVDGSPAIFFGYDGRDELNEIVSIIKDHFPYRRFVPPEDGGPYWKVGQRTAEDIQAIDDFPVVSMMYGHSFEKDEKVDELVNQGPKDDPPTAFMTEDGVPALKFPSVMVFSTYIVDTIKDHFSSRRYQEEPEKHWRLGDGTQTLYELRSFLSLHDEFETTDEVEAWMEETEIVVNDMGELSTAEDADITVDGFNGELLDYQRVGVKYATEKDTALIADEMGLGKTIQALATLEHKDAYPAVVIVPNRIKPNWRREANTFLPHRTVGVLEGFDGPIPDADIIVVNYTCLPKRLNQLRELDLVGLVADESHYCKNGAALDAPAKRQEKASERAQATLKLAQDIPVRLLLTGTPILNRPKELVHQLRILGQLGEFGGFWNFVKRYCDAKQGRWGWDFSGSSNRHELNKRLRETCMVRRLKVEVKGDLPPKQDRMVSLEIDQDIYDRAIQDFREWLAEADASEKNAEAMVRQTKLIHGAGRAKVKSAIEWVENFVESGEKLIVFAMHKDVQEALTEAFPSAATILSELSNEEVDREIQRFKEDDDCQLLIGAMGKNATSSPAGLGHNLQVASNVAFVELGWTPGHHDQCVDRVHRIGQDKPVTAWYLTGDGTIDDHIWDVLESKRQVADEVVDGAVVAREVLERVESDLS